MKTSHFSLALFAIALAGCKSNAPTAPTAPATVEKPAPEIAVESAAATVTAAPAVTMAPPTAAPALTTAPTTATTPPAKTMAQTTAKPYSVRGQVVSVPAPKGGNAVVEVKHENIPGFMRAMTMRLPLANPADAARLKPGDKIRFSMNPDNTQISNIQMLPASTTLKLAP